MLAPYAPFYLIFADSGVQGEAAFAALCGMLQPGGHRDGRSDSGARAAGRVGAAGPAGGPM